MTDLLLSKRKTQNVKPFACWAIHITVQITGASKNALQLSKYRLNKTITVVLHLLLKASLGLKLLFLASSHFLTFDRKFSM